MKFFRDKDSPHPTALFSPKSGVPIYAFSRGEFSTDDPEICGILLAMGFSTVPPERNPEPPVAIEPPRRI